MAKKRTKPVHISKPHSPKYYTASFVLSIICFVFCFPIAIGGLFFDLGIGLFFLFFECSFAFCAWSSWTQKRTLKKTLTQSSACSSAFGIANKITKSNNPKELYSKSVQTEKVFEHQAQPTETAPNPNTVLKGEIFTNKIKIKNSSDFKKISRISIVDLETTGLSPTIDKIVEIGVISMEDFSVQREFESLVNPQKRISSAASAVNGINDNMVKDSPIFSEISANVWNSISGYVVAAYNADFDISFLKNQLEESGISGEIEFFDILQVARMAFPEMKNHKLSFVASELGYPEEQTHRALSDTKMAAFVLQKSFEQIKQNELDARYREEEAKAQRIKKYSKSPLFDKLIAFTGDFNLEREELELMAEKAGAIIKNSVVMKLDYLVVGETENLPEWALERKLRKADRYIEKGCKIKKINESEYLKLIADALLVVETK